MVNLEDLKGLIHYRRECGGEDDYSHQVLCVFYEDRVISWRKGILNPIKNILGFHPGISKSGMVIGLEFYDSCTPNDMPELEKIIDKTASENDLWNIKFLPYERNNALTALIKTLSFRREGEIYVPERIEFDGSFEELRDVCRLYGLI